MKVYIVTNTIGAFALDGKNKLIHYKLFPVDAELIAKRLEDANKGELIKEEEQLLDEIKISGFKEIIWDKKIDFPGYTCLYEPDNSAKEYLMKNFRQIALELKWIDSSAELNKLLTKINVLLTKKKIQKPKKDKILMHAIGVVDEYDRVINTLSERMREWYGLHFPESDKLINSHEQLARIIFESGNRENIKNKILERYIKVSAGMPFTQEDTDSIVIFAKSVHEMHLTREKIAEYVKTESKKIIPNLSAVAGPLIAARLMSIAGGLEKLAKMSSSTIQLLGAEKALFRHLRGHGKAPKFGVIFAHARVQKAAKEEKGKVARLLAAKLTMAARADFYTGKNISEKLLEDLKGKVKNSKKIRKSKYISAGI